MSIRVNSLFLLAVLVAVPCCFSQPVFNVKDFGAVGDGVTLDSPAINSAIAAAGNAGGGTVTFPPGNYFCGSLHLTNNLTLYLSNNAVILASPTNMDDPETNPWSSYQDFGHSHFHNSMIWGWGLSNLTIAGPGKIDGNGKLQSSPDNSPANPGQGNKVLALVQCTNVVLNSLTIIHAGHFGLLANGCSNMTVVGVQFLCSAGSTHRDAFNLISSSAVLVSNCVIQGSDDAMVLKSDYALGQKINSHDIVVTGCQIFSTQNNALQFGSETVGDFSNVSWSHLDLTQAGKAGIGITSNDGSIIDGITYDDITMSNCACPIHIKLSNQGRAPGPPPVGRIRNISIRNVVAVHSVSIDGGITPRTNTATIDGYSDNAGTIIPVENITFSNVNLSTIGNRPATAITNYPVQNNNWTPDSMGLRPSFGWYIRFAQNISFTNCQVHFDQDDDRPAIIADTVTNIFFSGFSADVGVNDTNYDIGFLHAVNYQVSGAVATANAPVPGAALRVVPTNGIVVPPAPVTNFFFEAESIPFTTNGAAAALQTDSNSSAGKWEALEALATNGNPYIEYTLANVPAGTYQLNLKYKGNTGRGIITHAVDGAPLNDSLDQYSAAQTYPEVSLGTVTFTNTGSHVVRQTVVGKNPANTGQPWASADRFALLLLQPPSPVLTPAIVFTSGVARFSGTGYPTLSYRVQVTTNLGSGPWITLESIAADAGGGLSFVDTNPTAQTARFYRLVTP